MKLTLNRTQCGETATMGQLSIDGNPFCFTCEDIDRMLEDGDGSAKIDGETCIPRGIYKVIINRSTRFKRDLPLLVNVPFFDGIRIHPGNTTEDTHGCVLVGDAIIGDTVSHSRVTFDRLFALMQAADSIEIEVL